MNESKHILPKINIISPNGNLEPPSMIKRQPLAESFISDSYNSSFNSSLDSDIQQIKDITEALDRGIKSKLFSYKKLSQDLGEGITSLKEKFQECTQELDTVKINVADLLSETSQTHQFIKELREKELTNPSEDLLTSYSQNDFNVPEALKKMKEEIEVMQKKMEDKEAEYLKNEEELKAKYEFEQRFRVRRPKTELCSCQLF